MASQEVSQVRAFGKLPFSAEFVRYGLETVLGERFAEWMDQGLGFCHAIEGVRWFEDPRVAAGVTFIFPSEDANTKGLLLGTMVPSADRFGRQFPFTVAAELTSAARIAVPSTLPIGGLRFLGEAYPSHTASSDGELFGHLAAVTPPEDGELDAGAAAFGHWLRQPEHLAAMVGSLFPITEVGAGYEALGVIRFLAYLVNAAIHRASAPRSIGLPIGDGGGGFAPAFWLEIIRRLSGGALPMPAAFWSAMSTQGVMLVHLGPVQPATFGRLWGDVPNDPGLLDFIAPPLPNPQSLPDLPPAASAALLDPGASVETLLLAIDSLALGR